ncbi:MAG: DMT family transporter [Actinobacteria bacterium]|nr:MAG: DMT family transporter [Actinomycetota bacterium]
MGTIALALGASLAWGFADFFGPLRGRSLGALRVLVWAQLGGLAVIALAVLIRWRGPGDWAVLLAIPAAISGTLGLYAYYRGMAVGAMSVVAPIAGLSAIVPVIVGIVSGDRPSPWQLTGIACALIGVFLAAREPGRVGSRFAAGVGLALLAAIGFGGYFPPMHAAGRADFWWASLFFRLASTSVVLAAIAVRRPPLVITPRQFPALALIGIGDMAGNLLFAAAASQGLVSITSVLASLYPIVTIVLARAVLSERVARSQEAGIVLTLAGVALISVG